MNWCCGGFQDLFDPKSQATDGLFDDAGVGGRGVHGACREEFDGTGFFLEYRVASRQHLPEMSEKLRDTHFPWSPRQQMGIRFRPACGVRLAKFYSKSWRELNRLEPLSTGAP
jgi:hypothetical protein